MKVRSLIVLAILAPLFSHGAGAQSLSEDEQKIAQTNFKTADENGDGQLTKDEFRVFIDANAAAQLGRAPAIKRMGMYDRAFGRIDGNRDEKATWSEFRAAAGN